MQAGDLANGTYLYKSFLQEHGKGTSKGDLYHKQGNEEKKAFRLKWANERMEEETRKHTHLHAYQTIDGDDGEYLPFGAIVIKEGGWNDVHAVEGTKNLVSQALAMGGQWLRRNPQTKRLEFLHLRKTKKSLMTEKWSMFVESRPASSTRAAAALGGSAEEAQ